MRRYISIAIGLGVIIVGGALIVLALDEPKLEVFEANVISSDLAVPSVGFAQVAGDYEWEFPRDFGPHADFQREQWKISASTACSDLTFFLLFDRASFVPEIFAPERESAWAMQGIMTGSLTANDVRTELSSRIAVGLAGADENRVWLEDWIFEWTTTTWGDDWQKQDTGNIYVESENIRVNLGLIFDYTEELGEIDGWYMYQTKVWANGDIEINGEPYAVDCPMIMTRGFQ